MENKSIASPVEWISPIARSVKPWFVGLTFFVVYFALGIDSLHAGYRYVTEDPIAVQKRLVSDLLAGQLDWSNLDPGVVQGIQQGAPFSPSSQRLSQLGALKQICLLFGVKFNNGRNVSLRTVHQLGCADWLITSSEAPEIVRSIAFGARVTNPDSCGAPMFLPPPPAPNSSASFYIPPQLTCTDVRAAPIN